MKPESMDQLFHALAHSARRKILDLVRNRPGCSVNDVSKHFDVSRIAVIKHLRILEATQLIIVQKVGRRRALYFNAVPIQMIYDRWTSEYSGFWASKATDLKFRIEAELAGVSAKPPPSDARASDKKKPRRKKDT
jgi:DNA-binding transcriptional ArsR family regulator